MLEGIENRLDRARFDDRCGLLHDREWQLPGQAQCSSSRQSKPTFENAQHGKIFIEIGPVKPCSVADDLDTVQLFWRGLAQSPILGGWKADFTAVPKPHANQPVLGERLRGNRT